MAWSVIGNERAMAVLERAVASGSPAHAYLFSGPAGVGKALAAREFAAALCCEGIVRPCRACRNCRDILEAERHHPDVEVLTPGGLCDESDHGDHAAGRDIRICQVRRLQRLLSMTPYRGGRRVAILDGADRLTPDAANAFLKTLEEPPPDTVLLLVTDREEQLLETVLSRCQKVAFGRIERDKVEAALQDRGASPETARAVAALANGRLGWALRAIEDEELLAERESFLATAVELAQASLSARFAWARGVSEPAGGGRERYLRELDTWEQWWRDVLSVGAGAEAGIINTDRGDLLLAEGKRYAPADIVKFLRALQKTREHLQANVDAQLALEVLTLDLPRPFRPGVASR
jgi:DNA polymerase-3 subunit delta'